MDKFELHNVEVNVPGTVDPNTLSVITDEGEIIIKGPTKKSDVISGDSEEPEMQ